MIQRFNKIIQLLVYSIIFCTIAIPEAKSSHIVGGEMSYKCLGGQVYEITLTLRRDCFNGSPEAEFDDPAHIGIFDSEGAIVRSLGQFGLLLMDFRNDDTLNEILRTECEVVGGDVCVHTTTYRAKIELPFLKGGYVLAYQRCCRNKTITNIVDPELIGATYSVVISEDALRYCNTSPKFGAFPSIYICGDRPIVFDHQAFDQEGDSLVYSLCVPYAGADTANSKPTRPSRPPFPQVTYKFPFGLTDLLGGNPALRIDPATGLITGQPNAIGQYLVGICVDEYRNGKLLSRVRRDFQYNVRFCTTNPVARFTASDTVLCVGDSTIKFTNNSVNARDFTWLFDYPNTNYISKDTNPEFKFPKPGKYRVALVANRAKDCIDTNYLDVYLYGDGYLKSDFDVSYESCKDSIELLVTDHSFDSLLSIRNWQWNARLNNRILTSTNQNPKFIFQDTGKAIIQLTITSEGGCTDTIEKEFILNLLNPQFLGDKIPICIGESTKLLQNPDPRFKYTWSPTTSLSCAFCPDPIANPAADILYKLTISDGNCTEEDSVFVSVSNLLNIDIAGDSVICDTHIQLLANGGVENTIEWSDQADFSNILASGSFNFETQVNGKKTFYVRGKSGFNCPGSDSITVSNEEVLSNIRLDSVRVCEGDTFNLQIQNDNPEHQLKFDWDPETYIISGKGTENITLTIPKCGEYTFSVKATNQYNCSASDSVRANIICKPIADFKVEKNCDNTLVSFSNESSPGNYAWDFGDLETSNENSPVHFYKIPGRYTVTLKVGAECNNEITKIVDVGLIMVSLRERVVSCMGKPVKLNDNPDTNYTYQWSPIEGLDNPNSPNPTASISETKTYKVRVSDPNIPDCYVDREITVFVPPPINLNVNNDTVLCFQKPIILYASTDPGANVPSIEWTDEIGILLGTGYSLEKLFLDSMYVFAYATDIYGCGDVDSFRIIPLDTNYTIIGKDRLCPGKDGPIEFINRDGHTYRFDWSPERFIVTNKDQARILVKPADTTVFFLTFINEYGCAYQDSFKVNISRFDPPLLAFADPDTIYLGQSSQLSTTPGYMDYEWIIPYNLDCIKCPDPVASPENSTLYTVKAKNDDGCEGQTDVSVFVKRPKCNEEDVYFPNVFSPNDDQENDILRIRSNFLESVELYVYNRWGEKVFETKDINQWWDGTYKGVKLAPDVYGYYFIATCVDGNTYAKKGNVTLLR
ncbi:MAG: gliding motility-associated C-terminal domain-containing protein [Saprospiraceae bacterium]|nr:gliding motility-associated C-terminal domain-containing protein [Saprospiraceae bacterium]